MTAAPAVLSYVMVVVQRTQQELSRAGRCYSLLSRPLPSELAETAKLYGSLPDQSRGREGRSWLESRGKEQDEERKRHVNVQSN